MAYSPLIVGELTGVSFYPRLWNDRPTSYGEEWLLPVV